MLVLTRKIQQQIRIDDDVIVTVLRVKGNTVKLGIEAPRKVRVVRGELTSKPSQAESSATSQPAAGDLATADSPADETHERSTTGRVSERAGPRMPLLRFIRRATDAQAVATHAV